jgi:hypothetical protein
VVIHTASYGRPEMSITWTSPGTGAIDISGLAWDAGFDFNRDSFWELSVNGNALAERGTIVGTFRTDAVASFGNNVLPGQSLTGLTVGAGDVVEFRAVKTPSSPYGHFMGVDVTVDFTPSAVPEPSTYLAGALLLLPFGSSAIRLLRKNKVS